MPQKQSCNSAAVMPEQTQIQMKESNQGFKSYTLDKLQLKETAKIISIPEHSLLAPLGMREGKEIKVKGKQPFGGPFIIEVMGRTVAISRNIAAKIKIRKLNEC